MLGVLRQGAQRHRQGQPRRKRRTSPPVANRVSNKAPRGPPKLSETAQRTNLHQRIAVPRQNEPSEAPAASAQLKRRDTRRGVRGANERRANRGVSPNRGVKGVSGRQANRGVRPNRGVRGVSGRQSTRGATPNRGVRGVSERQTNRGVGRIEASQASAIVGPIATSP